jgi:hypothetical protein
LSVPLMKSLGIFWLQIFKTHLSVSLHFLNPFSLSVCTF